MSRCIQCTRCVRFGQEIQGIQELGTVGRGEFMQISTWIEKSVDHELSGNIIDLCPVGALNNKPYRYRARSWEMTQHPLVSPHDCVGTNLYGHVLRGRLMRVVPVPMGRSTRRGSPIATGSVAKVSTARTVRGTRSSSRTASGAKSTGKPRSTPPPRV
jgi:NADH dehydrogenase/NADH:ubiquinone oxidoreductase subunit G